MLHKKQTTFRSAIYFKTVHFLFDNSLVHISFLSVAFEGWQLAKQSFIDQNKKKRRKQQWKYFFRCLLNPRFAAEWLGNLKSPSYSFVVAHRKLLFIRPFRKYMSTKWTKKQNKKVILDTYRFIMSQGESFKEVLTNSHGIEIANFKLNETLEGHLNLSLSEEHNREGELVLSFKCDQIDGIITSAIISFEEQEEGIWACRIGCVQGHKVDDQNASKVVQKLLHGFRPKAFIVFTVQEFSRQFRFKAVYGVSDTIHTYRGKHAIYLAWRYRIQFDYNALWHESGGILNSDSWYELPLTPIRKSYEEIKTHKRALYRRRYSLCDDISLKIADTVKRLS